MFFYCIYIYSMSILNTLITIKNAQIAFLLETKITLNGTNLILLNKLLSCNLIRGYKLINNTKNILIYLHYFENKPLIKNIKIFSKPSKKIYIKKNTISLRTQNLYCVYSNDKGLQLTNMLTQVSGELLVYIYT